MKIEEIANVNVARFDPSEYSNSKKFLKVTQAAMVPATPYIEYEKINKKDLSSRDLYAAAEGDIVFCLMNTKSRLIGIVDQPCIVPNTFCVLRPKSVSTDVLYASLIMNLVQTQLDSSKKSITIKDVKEMVLPFDISPAHENVLKTLSKNFQTALLNRSSFQEILDQTFSQLKYTLPLPLETLVEFSDINKTKDPSNIGKKDLPFEEIMLPNFKVDQNCATILLPRRFKNIENLKLGIICNGPTSFNVTQSLLKLTVNTETLEDLDLKNNNVNELIIAKYLAYYFLSSRGKEQLSALLEQEHDQAYKTLKIDLLKQLTIPLPPNFSSILTNLEEQIYWHDTERYSNQLDYSLEMFDSFEKILDSLTVESEVTHYVSATTFTSREFAILFAHYLMGLPTHQHLEISVVLESFIHYELFEHHQEQKWDDTPIEFYSPIHDIEGDLIIVIQKSKQKLNLPLNTKVIYIKER